MGPAARSLGASLPHPMNPVLSRKAWLLLVALAGCERTKPTAGEAADARAAPTTSAASAPAQKGQCPIEIRSGEALGPIRIGQKRGALSELGLPVKSVNQSGEMEFVEVGPFHVELCGGAVVDTWIEDLRTAPDCVSVSGKKVDRAMARDAFIGLFPSCKPLPPRKGGSFVECDGGVRIGWGMGELIQVRVVKKGSSIDDSCENLLDDGKPVELPGATRAELLQKVLDLAQLAPFWHSDLPGRDPLRVLENDIVKDAPKLSMFGNPVVYVARSEAEQKKLPYFELTRLESGATKTRIEFRYPVEGVVGHAVFVKRGESWFLEEKEVAER